MIKEHEIKRILVNDISIPYVVEDRITSTLSDLRASSNQGVGVMTVNRTIHRTSRTIKKTVVVAAIITILSTFIVLASAGVLGDFFMALRDNSRVSRDNAIIEHGFIAEVESDGGTVSNNNPAPASVNETDINAMNFNAYYIDVNEIAFDFILSNVNVYIPDNFGYIELSEFTMEMNFADGNILSWTEIKRDDYHKRTTPDGYYLYDMKNQIFESEGENVFGNTVKAVKIGANDYSISVLNLHKSPITIGDTIRVSFKNFNFVYFDKELDISEIITIEGEWTFEIQIDRKFKDVRPLRYRVDERGYVPGVHIMSVTVYPSVCKIEARINFNESGLGLPENMNIQGTEHTTAEWQSAKMDLLELELIAYADGTEYHFRGSTIEYIIDDQVTCLFEIDSMFFDAPLYLILRFTNLNGVIVEIPLILN